jgi:hypothetical protein
MVSRDKKQSDLDGQPVRLEVDSLSETQMVQYKEKMSSV